MTTLHSTKPKIKLFDKINIKKKNDDNRVKSKTLELIEKKKQLGFCLS